MKANDQIKVIQCGTQSRGIITILRIMYSTMQNKYEALWISRCKMSEGNFGGGRKRNAGNNTCIFQTFAKFVVTHSLSCNRRSEDERDDEVEDVL